MIFLLSPQDRGHDSPPQASLRRMRFLPRGGVSTFPVMGTSHAETAGPGQPQPPVTLLESFSPYGSRKVTVEYDGLTTAAYLHDDTAAISATWIANHRPVPETSQAADQARLHAGRAPPLLA